MSASSFSESANSQIDPKSSSLGTTANEDSLDEDEDSVDGARKSKKTLGRVKIDMAYIDDKVRRYTTFSKRKTGIMKKAYELATLTGTEVMLLVASETGHVYTYATPKLQPMITSEAGKALIQTCLEKDELTAESSSSTTVANAGCSNDPHRKKRTNSVALDTTSCERRSTKHARWKSPDDIQTVTITSTPSTTVTVPLSCFVNLDAGRQSMTSTTGLNSVEATTMHVTLTPSPNTSQTSPSATVPHLLTFGNFLS